MPNIRNAVPVAVTLVVANLLLGACSGDHEDDTPPPPRPVNAGAAPVPGPGTTQPQGQPQGQPQAQPGQPVVVTVVANSTPPVAMVTGGGRQLGVTPLQTQVPVPPPQPGQVQTFAFTFQLQGYQTATINASPVNNTISITAALAPVAVAPPVQPEPVGQPTTEDGDGDGDDPPGGSGRTLRVTGRGGGRIYDNHTTRGSATVGESCTIDRLTVTLNGRHTYYGDLHIFLRDPSGNRYTLASGGRANPFRSHSVRRARGRQARGRWDLEVQDRLNADSGNLTAWSMRFTCRD